MSKPSRRTIEDARNAWVHTGRRRPDFAEEPGPGRESVWDYPRPPVAVVDNRPVVVRFAGVVIAETSNAVRVLETASPPTFYLPKDDVRLEYLEDAGGGSFCEWKGAARYYDVVVGSERLARAAWTYPEPLREFREIAGSIAFYPHELECRVAGERVQPQGGTFYGGWVTSDIAGPWKGAPGSSGW